MKKYVLTIVFSLLCTYIYSIEISDINISDINISVDYPRNIKSNGKELFDFSISNGLDIALYDLELSALNNDDLEIILDKLKIEKIEPKETIVINMEIINNNKYYYSKDIFITLKISNDEFSKDNRYKFTIKPVENFWFFIIISVALILSILFIVIFIKTNGGEGNVG